MMRAVRWLKYADGQAFYMKGAFVMNYKEVQKDLLALTKDCVIAHCISSDFALGGNSIARRLQYKYAVGEYLMQAYGGYQWSGHGDCLITDSTACGYDSTGGWLVCSLVTKETCLNHTTYQTLKESLLSMKAKLTESNVSCRTIAFPLLGCGSDGLQYGKVKEILCDVFGDTDFEILVCCLNAG